MSIVFATKCYEKNWQSLVSGGIDRKLKGLDYPFDHTMLVINNVDNMELVKGASRELVDTCIDVPNFLSDIYTTLKLDRDHFINTQTGVDGYNYGIGKLAAIIAAKDYDYLVYLQGDVVTERSWIVEGLQVLENEPDVLVVSPLSEVNTWHDDQGYDHYMSDHAWLVRVNDFLNPEVFHVTGSDPDYPVYGGNNFEHMIGKYLKQTGRKRKIITTAWAHHPVNG